MHSRRVVTSDSRFCKVRDIIATTDTCVTKYESPTDLRSAEKLAWPDRRAEWKMEGARAVLLASDGAPRLHGIRAKKLAYTTV
jgi:hypothetical protein